MAAFTSLFETIKAFRQRENGAVALLFALALLPLLAFVGVSIDYVRADAARTALQAALDETALSVARSASKLTQDQLQSQVSANLGSYFHYPDATVFNVSSTYSSSGNGSVIVTANAALDTTIMRVFGTNSVAVSASTTVSLGGGPRLRIALVLDNTGSMAQSGKMAALKSAAVNLIQQIQQAATNPEDAYVSIIPFNTDVNVGGSNYAASWVDWTEWNNANGSCSSGWGSTQSSCNGHWTPANHSLWNGCVMDRGNVSGPSSFNYDTNVTPPVSSNSATQFPAEQVSWCPQQVLPLSNNWTAMTTLVNGMVANGNTNQGIGLAHGWASLVGIGPYPAVPAIDPNYQYKNVIILLSDGLNTANRWYTSATSIDARQRTTCDNIKSAGMLLYTIQVNTGGDPTSSVLQYCASDASKFFLLTSSSQIINAFQQIGNEMAQMRISN